MTNLPPKHMHTAKGIKTIKQGFIFRWWMAVILVGIVAAIGIIILRFSHASVIPPEELAVIQTGIVIDSNITGATVSYPPYNYSRHFNIAEAIRAQQDPVEYQKLMDKVIADLEAIYVKNHPGGSSPQPSTNSAASTASSPDQQQTTQTTASGVATSNTIPSGSQSGATVKNSGNSSTNAVQDLGNVSGFTKFVFNPVDSNNVKSVTMLIDNKMVRVIKKPPYDFSVNTLNYSNGQHKMQVFTIQKDNKLIQSDYSLQIANKSTVSRLINMLSSPWQLLFK